MSDSKAIRRRKPQRLAHHDYTSTGAYFITVCTKDRQHLFGSVVSEEVRLNQAGKAVKQVWFGLPAHYPLVELDEFVVMPNHVHGILWIVGDTGKPGPVGEGLRPSPTQAKPVPSLTELVRAFKSFSAREINKLRKTTGSLWQRGFYEHIVRNDDDLHQHRTYIQNNPLKWALDEYYT